MPQPGDSPPVMHRIHKFGSVPTLGLSSAYELTCTCGASGRFTTLLTTVEWFGAHCYSAGLDRALNIIGT